MNRRCVTALFAAVLVTTALATAASAQVQTKRAYFYFEGTATAAGDLAFRLVPRDYDCGRDDIYSFSQSYDEVAGGLTPTTATEIRDAIMVTLAGIPAPFTASDTTIAGNPAIRINNEDSSTEYYFDVCVDGVKIVHGSGEASHSENDITVTGYFKKKFGTTPTPGVHPVGLAVVALTLLGGSILMLRRRAEARA